MKRKGTIILLGTIGLVCLIVFFVLDSMGITNNALLIGIVGGLVGHYTVRQVNKRKKVG